MIITIDTETQSLNTHNWLMGCVIKENGVVKTFRNREKMLGYIQYLAEQHKKQKKTLMIYAHNMLYDYLVLTQGKTLPESYQYSQDPFILDQKDEEGRIYAKWLSTTSLWRGALKEIGEALGKPKSLTPEWLKLEEYNPSWEELREAQKYMIQDTKIVMEYIKEIQRMLKEENMKPRWIITSSQIGISYLMRELAKTKEGKKLMIQQGWQPAFPKPDKPEEIHEACRGGRVEALRFGHYENCTTIDINSAFTEGIQKIEIPIQRTEERIENPLKEWEINALLSHQGISKCAIQVKKGKYGVLGIRINEEETHYPNKDKQILIGTWTHLELRKAIKNGYKILYIEWSRIYKTLKENPFIEIFDKIYKKKRESKNEIERHFYKMLQNGPIGKLAQRREEYEDRWEDIDYEKNLLKAGYKPIEAEGRKRLYRKTKGINYPTYYNPIIYAHITAYARIKLLEHMEKMNAEKVYYCDTDSITANDNEIKKAEYTYGKEIGEFKIETEKQEALIYGKKSYMVGKNIKLSGVGKAWIDEKNFREGIINYKKMRTSATTAQEELIGTFHNQERNLLETTQKSIETIKKVEEQEIIIDAQSESSLIVTKISHGSPKRNTRTSNTLI